MQVKRMNKTFPLGRLVMTLNAKKAISIMDMNTALNRHANCDWGNVCEEDWNTNNEALENGDRLLSVYHSSNGTRFWIITEWDRTVTTILLPEDY
jgi:hypothetical protein